MRYNERFMRALRNIALLGSILTLILTAPGVKAADILEEPDLSRFLRWGPFRVRPGFKVSEFGHDDNVFYRSSAPQGDVTIKLSPRIEGLLRLGGRSYVDFSEQLDYKVYYEFQELNFVDHAGKYRAVFPFSDYGFFVDTELRRAHERPVDLEDTRTIRNSRKVGLGAVLRLGWRTSLELEYADRRFNYKDEDFGSLGRSIGDLQDRNETGESARFRYKAMGRTSLTFEIQRRVVDFSNPFLLSEPDVIRNLSQVTWLPGIEFGEGGALSGSLRIGLTHLTYQDPTLRPYRGPTVDSTLAYHFRSGTRISLKASRRVDFSVWENNAYLVNQTEELRAVHYLNRLIGVEAGYLTGSLDVPHPLLNAPRTDDIQTVSGGLKLRLFENDLGRRVEYTLRFSRYRRDSSVPNLDQTRNTVTVSADLGF